MWQNLIIMMAEAYRQNYEDAIPNLIRIPYDPTNGEEFYNLANAYYRSGRKKLSCVYQQIIEPLRH